MNQAVHARLAPEPAPAGMAGGMVQWTAQESACLATLKQWQSGHDYPTRLPGFRMAPALEADDCARQDAVPPPGTRCMPGLRAEPVARRVQTSMQPVAGLWNAVTFPQFHVAADMTTTLPAPYSRWMAVPAAELAARLVAPQSAPQIEYALACEALPVLETPARPVYAPALCEAWIPGAAAEAVWQFVRQSVSPDISAWAPELRLPALTLCAALESVEAAAEAFAEPPPCSKNLARAPEPEPVFSYMAWSAAGPATPGIAPPRAVGLLPAIPGPHVPAASRWMASPAEEPLMAAVWPHVAGNTVPAMAVPSASYFRDVASPALAAAQSSPALAGAAIGAQSMGVESPMVDSSAAVPCASGAAVRMQRFALAATEPTAPGFEKPFLSPPPSTPKMPGKVVALRPISTISVTQPRTENCPPATSMPQPGIIPVDYHPQRLRGTPVCRVQWLAPRISPAPPRFVVRPVFDRLNADPTRQKPTRKAPAFAEVFAMPEARKRAKPGRRYAGWTMAAGLLVGGMFFGVNMARLSRQSTIARQDVFGNSSETAGSGHTLSAASRPAAEAAGRAQSKGPVAWVRRTIASRAAYQAADNFHNGMQAWGSAPKSYASGWERNREGYIHPGALAIFNPSRNFTDYRFEFFGQVEQKSMGWVVRAKDKNNYYAMKFKVLEAGLRPIMAVVHYAVVEGEAGHQVETPLSVMVHNNKPFQVAVEVKGNHFSASIDGEEVDSWSDDALPSGGVGFFAEAGERSRLYWMKISKNDDWLGSVCSMLAGSDAGSRVTSELWGGAGSGNMPRGGIPASRPADSGDMALAAAGLGLPFFPTPKTRNSKNRRYRQWNS